MSSTSLDTSTTHHPPNGSRVDEGFSCCFTVFTATYNRAHTLRRVYESLESQTFRNFEWLIVDDGSTDATEEAVRDCAAQAGFPVRYLYQENGGKHTAWNRGVREARGRFFLSLDSDDACVPTALETLARHWEESAGPDFGRFCSVVARCMDQHGNDASSRFPRDAMESNQLEMFYRHGLSGEQWPCFRTTVIAAFPFPEGPERMRYYPEGVIFKRMARTYRSWYINDCLRIYWTDQSSLVRTAEPTRNARPLRIQTLAALNEELDWFFYAPLLFARYAMHFSRFSFFVGSGLRSQYHAVRPPFARLLWLLMLGFGWLLHLKDKARACDVVA